MFSLYRPDKNTSVNFDMSASLEEPAPSPGEWPVDPQEDTAILENRVWVDGCFDFSHHGEKSIPVLEG